MQQHRSRCIRLVGFGCRFHASISDLVDARLQVNFCTKPLPTTCYIERIFDQSPNENHLELVRIWANNTHAWPSRGPNAMRDELTVGGHAVFSAYFEGGQRNIPGLDSGKTNGCIARIPSALLHI